MVKKNHEFISYDMKRVENGVFSLYLSGDYDNCEYLYQVRHHDSFINALDPYAYSSSANGRSSIIIDLNKCMIDLNRQYLKPLKQKTDAILYELSVRDFTMYENSPSKHKGKFLGVSEAGLITKHGNNAGLDYLVNLGITHVQLMPIFDFATVDENQPHLLYNWGYDPAQYNVPERSYCSDPNDGYSSVLECKEMIAR